MPSNYPGSLDALTNPNAGDSQATVSHSAQHTNANDAIEAIEATLGVNPQGGSASVTARLDTLAVGAASSLRQLPVQMTAGERLLREAVWWIDAAHSSASGQSVTNLGWGGSALNAQVGSGTGVDSNDPKFLDWSGTNYVYLPGVAANYLSVPDENALDITGDIDIRVQVALDDWTPSALTALASKYDSSGGNQSWYFAVNTDGTLNAVWVESGGTSRSLSSSVAPVVADGAALWVRWTLDVDNGAGQYDVKFWTSSDGSNWSQLGVTRTGSTGVSSVFASTYLLAVGMRGSSSSNASGRFYRAQVRDGIDGTTVLDVDTSLATSGSASTFTARTGQTVTVNRSSSGQKACVVTHPVWLFGSDDYMEVADNDLLDFGASESFTALAVVRLHATAVTNGRILSKWAASGAGWVLASLTGTTQQGYVSDGTISANPQGAITYGALTSLAMVRGKGASTLALYRNTASSSVTDNSGSLANALTMRVGREAGLSPQYADMELVGAAVFRRALTAAEITTLTNYYSGRVA